MHIGPEVLHGVCVGGRAGKGQGTVASLNRCDGEDRLGCVRVCVCVCVCVSARVSRCMRAAVVGFRKRSEA